jgi:hypothetical protein
MAAIVGGLVLLAVVVVAEVVRHQRRPPVADPIAAGIRLEVTPSRVSGLAEKVYIELDEAAYYEWMKYVPITVEVEGALPPHRFAIEEGGNSWTIVFENPTAVSGKAYVARGRDPATKEPKELLRRILP